MRKSPARPSPYASAVDPTAVEKAAEHVLDADDAARLTSLLSLLADPVRLRILSRITSAPDGEICVCEITGDDFDVSGPTISHHLKVLREAGLIEGERRGTWVYYRPVPANIKQLAAVLH